MNDVLVNVMTDEQIHQVSSLAHTIWKEYYPSIISNDLIDYLLTYFHSAKALQEQINEGYHYYLIKDRAEAKYIGYVAYQAQENKLFLSKYYILKEARGKGYGRIVMDELMTYAKQHSLTHIWLQVNRFNTDSIAMYRHFGFDIVEEKVTDVGHGYVMDDYILQLELSNALSK